MPALLRLKAHWKCACFLFSLHNQIAGPVPVFIIVSYVKRGWLLISKLRTANIVANTCAFYFLILGRPESKWIEINRPCSASNSWGDLPTRWKTSFAFQIPYSDKNFEKDGHGLASQVGLLLSMWLWESYGHSRCPAASSKMQIKIYFSGCLDGSVG